MACRMKFNYHSFLSLYWLGAIPLVILQSFNLLSNECFRVLGCCTLLALIGPECIRGVYSLQQLVANADNFRQLSTMVENNWNRSQTAILGHFSRVSSHVWCGGDHAPPGRELTIVLLRDHAPHWIVDFNNRSPSAIMTETWWTTQLKTIQNSTPWTMHKGY